MQDLYQQHQAQERAFQDLVERVKSGDSLVCDAVWDEFCADLLSHLQFEEDHILPRYRRSNPGAAADAEELLAQHAAIRQQLDEMGMALQLHLLRAEIVERFVAMMRAHAEHENRTLYPWERAHRDELGVPVGL